MSTPLLEFSNLSIGTLMSTTPDTDLTLRKNDVRNILSLFTPDSSEEDFRSDVYNQIDTGQGKRSSEWTIPGDLEGSLMQWGVHDDNCYFCLMTLNSNLQAPVLEAWNRKKIEVRDILSSFDRESLPEEYRADVFNQIELNQSRRPYSGWTIPGDLEGSLMQWAVHNENFYNLLKRCQSPDTRAVLFDQKISRRLHSELTAYENLPRWESSDQFTELSGLEARKKVHDIAERILGLTQMAHRDYMMRPQVSSDRSNRAKPLVRLLRQICESRKDFPPTQRIGRQSTRSGDSTGSNSLFQHLICAPYSDVADGFLLKLLGTFSKQLLDDCKGDLKRIAELLQTRKATRSYIDEFLRITAPATAATGRLIEAEYQASQTVQESTASHIAESSHTGLKRPAADSSGRRARRKTTK